MTRTVRFVFAIAAFFSLFAFAQTYVRPSKGTPLNAFEGVWDSGISLYTTGSSPVSQNGKQFEWSAFEAARVRIDSISGTKVDGGTCTGLAPVQYTISGMNTVIRPYIQKTGTGYNAKWIFILKDKAAPTAPGVVGASFLAGGFETVRSPFATMNLSALGFLGCTVTINITPIPFAPNETSSYPYSCSSSSVQNKTLMDGGSIQVTVANGNRLYTVVQNAGDDNGTDMGAVKCILGTSDVTMDAGTPGTIIPNTWSVTYPGATDVTCNGPGGAYVGTFECVP